MSSIVTSPSPAVQRWEDAHSCLLSSLTSYMDACMALKNASLAELATNSTNLVPRIERHTASLGSFVTCQVSQAHTTLLMVRNKLVSPIYVLPEEILAEIFTCVVYDTTDDEHRDQSMEQDLKSIYRRLYSLIGVCSSWRNVAVRKGSLWSVVPIIDKCGCSRQPLEDVTERSLRRSNGTGIHIAVKSSLNSSALLRLLTNHGNNISALNFRTGFRHMVEKVISTLATLSTPGVLSELSVCLDPVDVAYIPSNPDYKLLQLPFLQQERLKQMLGLIRSLRIRVVHLDLYHVSFTHLVELRIEQLRLGDRLMFKRLLEVISSAVNLQHLKCVDVSSEISQDLDIFGHDEPSVSIHLPNLKVVHLADMWFNDLEMIFSSFIPKKEKWILSLGDLSLIRNVPGAFPKVTLEQLCLLFLGFNVDTLMLVGRRGRGWLHGSQLPQLLGAAPTMKTLQFNNWDVQQEEWRALAGPQDPAWTRNIELPHIRNLHLYDTRISDDIRDAVKRLSIQQLRLGGFLNRSSDGIEDWREIVGTDVIVSWLMSNVPDFRLVGCGYDPPESFINEWRLW